MSECKTILICGGVSRAGLDIADKLIEAGHKCIVAGRRHPEREALDPNMHYEHVDFSDSESIDDFCKKISSGEFSISDCIFNQRSRSEDLLEGMKVSVVSTVQVIESIEDQLIKNKGSIVYIGSILGDKTDVEQTLSYHIQKGSLKPLIQYLSVKYSQKGINVNLISLSTLQHSKNILGYQEGKILHKISKNMIPIGRPISSEDVFNTITFLTSASMKGLTGQVITLDGGLDNLSQVSCITGWNKVMEER